jgi:hypothetical protein
MQNSSDTIGNRTRDLPACSAVPQPTAPPRLTIETLFERNKMSNILYQCNHKFRPNSIQIQLPSFSQTSYETFFPHLAFFSNLLFSTLRPTQIKISYDVSGYSMHALCYTKLLIYLFIP